MARDPQSGSFNLPVVDEQTKIQAMRTPAQKKRASIASFRKFEETGMSSNTEATDTAVTPDDDPVDTPVAPKLFDTYTDPDTGDIIDVYDDGSEKVRKKGTLALGRAKAAADALEEKRLAGKSAYDILYNEFKKYGLESLVKDVEGFIKDGLSEAEFTLKLRDTKAYQTRFAANAKRIANGFAAIDEATYLGLEDTFQTLSQNYGMPAKYYAKNNLGTQSYF